MIKGKYLLKVISGMMCVGVLAGCSLPAANSSSEVNTEDTEEKETDDEDADADDDNSSSGSNSGGTSLGLSDTGIPDMADESLAQRMCGKYSYHSGSDGAGNDEYLIMNVITFGDNLYAFCGYAMADEESLESYSFWASEFIPYDAAEMESTEGDSVRVKELRFSVMSQAGKYWDNGQDGTITLTDEGLLFENFDNEEFLCPKEYGGRQFLKDERVEDVFAYLNNDNGYGEADLQGVWVAHEGDYPVYLKFQGNNFFVYQKEADSEVVYAAGGYETAEGTLTFTFSFLGCGNMPCEYSAEYKVSGDELVLTADDYSDLYALSGEMRFSRVNADDIHLFTADEVADPSGVFGEYSDGFYGIWIAAEKEQEKAVEKAQALYNQGFDSYVTYSPEWEKLNSKPFYCVTAGRYGTEADANDALEAVKASYPDAYVKFTGARKFVTVVYINYGDVQFDVSPDRVLIKDVEVSETNVWYPGCEDVGTGYTMTLVLDRDTVFDDTCDTSFFANYEKGDKPLDWFIRSYDLSQNDPETYIADGPALLGVFEVGINGDHIDSYYGSYWWD